MTPAYALLPAHVMTPAMVKRVSSIAISLVYAVVRTVTCALLRLLRTSPGLPTVVLTYHAVPKSDVRYFEAQMRDLIAIATPVFADERGCAGDRRTVAVTFDDGFQSVFDNALPIMARLGIPSTLFVPTGYLAAPPGWIPVLRQQVASSGLVASADAVAATNRSLVRVGSHTVTHPNLVSQPADALHAELASSKEALEGITGGPVRMLSFPYGSFNTGVLAAAGAVGYDHVFANVPVFAGVRPGAQLFGRINVSPRDWRLEFQLKVRGAYSWMALAVPVKRTLVGFLKRARLR